MPMIAAIAIGIAIIACHCRRHYADDAHAYFRRFHFGMLPMLSLMRLIRQIAELPPPFQTLFSPQEILSFDDITLPVTLLDAFDAS